MTDIKCFAVESSNIAAIGYDRTTRVLRVRLRDGRAYDYGQVPADAAFDLLYAESHGSYLNRVIAPHYSFRRVNARGESGWEKPEPIRSTH